MRGVHAAGHLGSLGTAHLIDADGGATLRQSRLGRHHHEARYSLIYKNFVRCRGGEGVARSLITQKVPDSSPGPGI